MTNYILKSACITLTDDAHCFWVFNYLKRRNWITPKAFEPHIDFATRENAVLAAELIEESFENLHVYRYIQPSIDVTKRQWIEQMNETYVNAKISATDLRLVKGINERVLNAFWIHIRSICENNPNTKKYQDLYGEMSLDQSPITSERRRELIHKFIQFLEWPRTEKLRILETLKDMAQYIRTFDKSFTWLDIKNENQCDWALAYMKRRITIEPHISPVSVSEKFCSALAIFDYWNAPLDTKKLFLLDIRRAWSQKKHREKLEGKKPYNFIMKKNLAKKLDLLSEKMSSNKNELVEKLIEDAFSKHFTNK